MALKIAERPSLEWDLRPTLPLRIDRSGVTVADYLHDLGISWTVGEPLDADIELVKEAVGPLTRQFLTERLGRRWLSRRPSISLIGEPREIAPAAYALAGKANTLAVAPGKSFRRLFFASEWLDPQLENWSRRLDRICWIARPTPGRIELAEMLIRAGVPLDIYSRTAWPLPEWRGFAEDEVATSRQYRYRIVCENSSRHGYHSEKFFNSIRSGCVTCYQRDPNLDLSHAAGTYLPLDVEAVKRREEASRDILTGMERFMFSDAWEIYSFRSFYDRILNLAAALLR
jgi:hypothetical protein